MLQSVAVCCSVLQSVAVCCSALQCVAYEAQHFTNSDATAETCCNDQRAGGSVLQSVAVCCSVLQCVAVCCSVLQRTAVCCSVLQCVAVRCSVLQCVAVCCSVLHMKLQNSRTQILPQQHVAMAHYRSHMLPCPKSWYIFYFNGRFWCVYVHGSVWV